MTGPDDDELGPEDFRPVPHPDDRLWRHPSEMAAMHSAHANADTAKVPAVHLTDPRDSASTTSSKSRVHVALLVAAGAVAIGATAATLGALTSGPAANRYALAAGDTPVAIQEGEADAERGIRETSVSDQRGEEALAARLHHEMAMSLPRIQAATSTGMREGSGLFVTSDGHIATSAGLVDGARYVLAWTGDGRRWKAHVVASDPFSDVAVLRIDSDDWPEVDLKEAALLPGQYAVAIDHRAGSMNIGQVMSDAAAIPVEPDSMSTRVLIEQARALPGSAILDDTGAVIAMTNASSTTHATPAWMIQRVAQELIATGQATHPWLGVHVETALEDRMARVTGVVPGSPAEIAGLAAGDLIEAVDGQLVADAPSLWARVQSHRPGDELALEVTTDGLAHTVTATLTELPE